MLQSGVTVLQSGVQSGTTQEPYCHRPWHRTMPGEGGSYCSTTDPHVATRLCSPYCEMSISQSLFMRRERFLSLFRCPRERTCSKLLSLLRSLLLFSIEHATQYQILQTWLGCEGTFSSRFTLILTLWHTEGTFSSCLPSASSPCGPHVSAEERASTHSPLTSRAV